MLVTMLGMVSPAINPKTAKLTSNSERVKPSLKACGLWLVACGLWLVACGLWLVACGLF
ncbi:MAG: hypothetical protein NTW61_04045 [Candidatus Melainabacteria bacterium]|nr:hypothetical protein [Candidatus Melainabacteria bacterium]